MHRTQTLIVALCLLTANAWADANDTSLPTTGVTGQAFQSAMNTISGSSAGSPVDSALNTITGGSNGQPDLNNLLNTNPQVNVPVATQTPTAGTAPTTPAANNANGSAATVGSSTSQTGGVTNGGTENLGTLGGDQNVSSGCDDDPTFSAMRNAAAQAASSEDQATQTILQSVPGLNNRLSCLSKYTNFSLSSMMGGFSLNLSQLLGQVLNAAARYVCNVVDTQVNQAISKVNTNNLVLPYGMGSITPIKVNTTDTGTTANVASYTPGSGATVAGQNGIGQGVVSAPSQPAVNLNLPVPAILGNK